MKMIEHGNTVNTVPWDAITLTHLTRTPLRASRGALGDLLMLSPARSISTESIPVWADDIPQSFLRGLADAEAGRIVDIERAHSEKPPGE